MMPSSFAAIMRNARSTSEKGKRCVVSGEGSIRLFLRSRIILSIRTRPPGQRAVRIVFSAIPTPHSNRGMGTLSP